MASVNKLILIGNVGKDPESSYTQGGMAITKLSLATTEKRKDKDGNRKESTDWHRIVFFGNLAEIVAQYVTNGSQICVIGRIKYGSYDKDGVKHYTTDIIGDEMQMLGGRSGGDSGESRSAPRQERGQSQVRQQSSQQEKFEDFDDDIPF